MKSGPSLTYDRVPKQHYLFVLGLFGPWQRKAQQKRVFLNKKNYITSQGETLLEIRKITNYIEMFLNLKTSLHLKLKAKVYEKIKRTGKLRWHLRKGRAAFPNTKKTKRRLATATMVFPPLKIQQKNRIQEISNRTH